MASRATSSSSRVSGQQGAANTESKLDADSMKEDQAATDILMTALHSIGHGKENANDDGMQSASCTEILDSKLVVSVDEPKAESSGYDGQCGGATVPIHSYSDSIPQLPNANQLNNQLFALQQQVQHHHEEITDPSNFHLMPNVHGSILNSIGSNPMSGIMPSMLLSPGSDKIHAESSKSISASLLDKLRAVLISTVCPTHGSYTVPLYSTTPTSQEICSKTDNGVEIAPVNHSSSCNQSIANVGTAASGHQHDYHYNISLPQPISLPSYPTDQFVTLELDESEINDSGQPLENSATQDQLDVTQQTEAVPCSKESSDVQNVVDITDILPAVNANKKYLQGSNVVEVLLPSNGGSGSSSHEETTYHVIDVGVNPCTTDEPVYCVECNKRYTRDCYVHSTVYTEQKDREILSRARSSLPTLLKLSHYIDPQADGKHVSAGVTVLAAEKIPAKTQFGPMVGNYLCVDMHDGEMFRDYMGKSINSQPIWQIFQNGKPFLFLDCRSEEESNWMMFVRRAENLEQQNVVVYQKQNSLYFITRCDIDVDQPLLYWYASDYAALLDLPLKPDDLNVCDICGNRFLDRSAMRRHQLKLHPNMSNRKYVCPVCQKRFSSRSKVDVHMVTHSGNKSATCEVCLKSFSTKSNLRNHMKIHWDQKDHTCPICQKSFRQKAHLTDHMALHTGLKTFACTHCSKKFPRANDLKQHSYIHVKSAHYHCDICPKSFHRRQNLQKHSLVHDSNRPKFTCEQCRSEFSSKSHLKRHLVTCSGVKTPVILIQSVAGAEVGVSIVKKRMKKTENKLSQENAPS